MVDHTVHTVSCSTYCYDSSIFGHFTTVTKGLTGVLPGVAPLPLPQRPRITFCWGRPFQSLWHGVVLNLLLQS
jgi:hypothetical protein